MAINSAKFSIGDVVRHKHFDFRGVIYDVDFEFNNSEEWYRSIPKDVRPRKDQPFYHLLAENNEENQELFSNTFNEVLTNMYPNGKWVIGDYSQSGERLAFTINFQDDTNIIFN